MRIAFVDLDYTVQVNPFWPGVFPHFARRVAAAASSRPTERAVIEDLMRRSKAIGLAGDIGANDWDGLTHACAAGFGVAWSEPVASLVERYRDHAFAVPGAHEMLAALRDGGWTCVAASAGHRRFQLPTLRHLGLIDGFDRMVFADDAGAPKGRRRFYGVIPAEATHVASIGDSYQDDCLYPTHFGFAAVWFSGARRSDALRCGRRPHAHVDRLEGVAPALDAIARSRALAYNPPHGPTTCPTCEGPGDDAKPCSLCRCLARDRHERWDRECAGQSAVEHAGDG